MSLARLLEGLALWGCHGWEAEGEGGAAEAAKLGPVEETFKSARLLGSELALWKLLKLGG